MNLEPNFIVDIYLGKPAGQRLSSCVGREILIDSLNLDPLVSSCRTVSNIVALGESASSFLS